MDVHGMLHIFVVKGENVATAANGNRRTANEESKIMRTKKYI